MVYAANGGFVLDGIAYGATLHRTPSASPRVPPTWSGSRANGFDVREPVAVNEGEGDFLLVGDTILAGTGFRSDCREPRRAAHASSAARS